MNIALVKFTTNYKEDVTKMTDMERELEAYSFRNEIATLQEGNFVVVKSRNGLGIGIVTKLLENSFENSGYANKAVSYVVDTIDVSSLVAREEAAARREWLKKELKRKKDQMEDLLVYKMLAEHDSEAASMLDELKLLSN